MSPRRKFIEHFLELKEFETLLGYIYDTMQLASTHDPDYAQELRRQERWINRLFGRVAKLEQKAKKH